MSETALPEVKNRPEADPVLVAIAAAEPIQPGEFPAWQERGWEKTCVLSRRNTMDAALYQDTLEGVIMQLEDGPGPDDAFRVVTGWLNMRVGEDDKHRLIFEDCLCIFVNLTPEGDIEYAARARQAAQMLHDQGLSDKPLDPETKYWLSDLLRGPERKRSSPAAEEPEPELPAEELEPEPQAEVEETTPEEALAEYLKRRHSDSLTPTPPEGMNPGGMMLLAGAGLVISWVGSRRFRRRR